MDEVENFGKTALGALAAQKDFRPYAQAIPAPCQEIFLGGQHFLTKIKDIPQKISA